MLHSPAPLEFLTQTEAEAIHAASLEVLERTGVEIREEHALEILGEAGARIDRGKRRARLPGNLVERLVRQAPAQFSWHGRDPSMQITLGDGSVHFGTTFGSSTIEDLAGERRPAVYQDLETTAALIDALPWVEEGSAVFMPDDRPKEVQWLWAFVATVLNSRKPIRGRVYGREQARFSIQVAELIAGGAAELRARPLLMANTNTVSPLMQHREQVEALLEYARSGLPVIISPEVIAGATGPVTLAGGLVQHNAEVLCGMALVQAVRPGCPVVYGTVSSIMDMRTGAFAHGAIEHGMWSAMAAQMARFYGVPSRGNAGFSDSKCLDLQAGAEMALTLLLAALGGIHYIFGAVSGVIDAGLVVSLRKLVADDDTAGSIRRLLGGVDTGAAALAVELIHKVGPGGSYLGERHTLQHLRREHFLPALAERRSYPAWQADGAHDSAARARSRALKLLAGHTPASLEPALEAEILRLARLTEAEILARAAR